jgi:hypothetical protein
MTEEDERLREEKNAEAEKSPEDYEKLEKWINFIFDPVSAWKNEGIQKIIFDDAVKDLLENTPNLPKVSSMGLTRAVKFSKMYLAPNIPDKKIKNGISNDRFGVIGLLEKEDVFALIDEKTALFAPKNGLMITNIGIFCRTTETNWDPDYPTGAIGLPWRIDDSRITSLMHAKTLMLSEIALEIDGMADFPFPVGGTGLYNSEMLVVHNLISGLIDIANEQNQQ